MKRTLIVLLTVMCMVSLIVPCTAISTATADFYTDALDGDLLYTVNFNGDEYYAPTGTQGALIATVDATNSNKVSFVTASDKALNYWGAEITCLPLNNRTAYTIYATATRDGNEACLGIYFDYQYGIYGYSYNQRFLCNTTTILGHSTMKYSEMSPAVAAEGDINSGTKITAGQKSTQRYAIEVNGRNKVVKMYVMTAEGNWALIDKTTSKEIPFFYSDYLGLYFYQYFANQPITVSDVAVYKGMTISKEVLDKTTTAPAITVAEPTSVATPDTTAAATESGGCSSGITAGAVIGIILIPAVACLFRKKRR